MKQHTLKTTVVLVAMGDQTQTFRSAESVPVPLRKRMRSTAARGNSATILIADRRGRREVARAVQGLPSAVSLRISNRLYSKLFNMLRSRADIVDILLVGLAGTLLWAAVLLR